MASPLKKDDRARFHLGKADIKGGMGKDSMLLDYISLDIISCIAAAQGRSEYTVILGLLLATFSNSVYVVVGRIFAFVEMPSPGGGVYFVVTIQKRNFFAAFAIMIVYIVSLWILRPRGAVRTCRCLNTLMDLALLVQQSPVLQCPEFWLQDPSDMEDHLRAQVTLADRVYRYGVYKGYNEDQYVGIAPHSIPSAWKQAAANAGAGVTFPGLYYSIELARDMLRYGVYDDATLTYAWDILDNGPRTQPGCVRVRSNEYRSWRKGFRRPGRARGNIRSHEDEASTTSSYSSPVPDPGSGSYQ
ncbi:hypothetical protein COL154_013527 [Colletotrichum chrysophilum]|uniref:uncharacterized protein n=1 Tax=Colletotrichum chrysophilum TaxID=1836956 RepID=UPI002301A227|nr:uncharacterized protein COL26b_012881 [Colletotrichum chrysophilum]KAJ0339324.1 hypothetical protein KNSL1_012061 [Colletotrichum chrysophilum]KAJ0349617.1 hypothetical protein COL154_013527 [Colletotrichum chrysophilum]KAJ0363671.1 hypothetical protein COL26b_012881 [Colletotrichum chrysophilum]